MSEQFERNAKAAESEPSQPSIDLTSLFPPIKDTSKATNAERSANGNNAENNGKAQDYSKQQIDFPKPVEFNLQPKKAETDKVAMLQKNADGKIEIGEKDFDKIGPIAAKVLRDAGVTKLTLTPGKDHDTYEAELKKPLEINQDPAEGARKLKIGTHFKADVIKNPDGSMTLDHIDGLKAESKVLFQWRDVTVDKIQLNKLPDGTSEITSTGTWNGISRDNTRIKPGEIFDKAQLLFNRMEGLKSPQDQKSSQAPKSFLEITPIKKD